MHLPAAAVLRCLNHTSQVLDCVENVPPDTLLGVWKELSAASEQLRLLIDQAEMVTRGLRHEVERQQGSIKKKG